MTNRHEIFWSPRVSLAKIRLFYEKEARGICDNELIEDVGIGLLMRCQSIIEFTEACDTGRVPCMRCARQGKTTIIQRNIKKPSALLQCPVCAWQVRWRIFKTVSEKADGQLYAGHALDAFIRYMEVYPSCRTMKEKIIAIDQLIHEFHWFLIRENQPAIANKPAGVNLLQGNIKDIFNLLNELTYGKNTSPELLNRKKWWLEQQKKKPK